MLAPADTETEFSCLLGLRLGLSPPLSFLVSGSTLKRSSITDRLSLEVEDKEKGAVGLATPSLTGARRALPVSHSSSMEMLISAWKTLLQACRGCLEAAGDFFLFCPGEDSTESATNILATDRTNLLMTLLAWLCLLASVLVVYSCLIRVERRVSSISWEHFTSRQWLNLSSRAVPD